jgi:hypothetical protein
VDNKKVSKQKKVESGITRLDVFNLWYLGFVTGKEYQRRLSLKDEKLLTDTVDIFERFLMSFVNIPGED